jgi:urate oxidase
MPIHLAANAYGKNAINLSKIIRHANKHDIRQISVNVSLQGEFEKVHTIGDNVTVLPTDTMKNTVYALAKEYFTGSIEAFGICMTGYFLQHNPQVSEVNIDITEYCWARMVFDDNPHTHSFVNGGLEKRTAHIQQSHNLVAVTSGIKDLLVLKTTDSGFENYIRDGYTTLKETNDRIFSTSCEVSWLYDNTDVDFISSYDGIRNCLLQVFAAHKSLSVQHTLYAMGEEVLKKFDSVKEISLKMPNKHHILFNLAQFGLENNNEIFIATDEPYGYITGTVVR